MKQNGNSVLTDERLNNCIQSAVAKNPLRDDAFDVVDSAKIEMISEKFKDIIEILGLDLLDDSIKDTPSRVAKMYVEEIFSGINPKNKPRIALFKNTYQYHTPLMELNIPFTSYCEHHFVPIQGKANIAYTPKNYVIGLSKIHRLVDYYARRPQVQERLTQQVFQELVTILQTNDVGVVLKASHGCISCRGVQDVDSSTITSAVGDKLREDAYLISILFDFNKA